MTAAGRSRLRAVLAAASVAVTLGCGPDAPPPPEKASTPPLGVRSGAPRLRLLAWAPADTVRHADSIPLAVALWNEGPPTDVWWNRLSDGIEVIGPRGRRVEPDRRHDWHRVVELPGWIRPLPPGAFFGHVFNLACGVDLPETPERRLSKACDFRYRIAEPGDYRVVAHYFTVPPPGLTSPRAGIDYLELHSDTARFTFAPGR